MNPAMTAYTLMSSLSIAFAATPLLLAQGAGGLALQLVGIGR